ncbi:DNA polymerase III subunit alpha [Streptomyces chartreusis]|uniref:DNA polymerase III subunit alpha n=1 Tax=Streptomyces chartreusis TaxID=1969 RepID=UPI0033AF5230
MGRFTHLNAVSGFSTRFGAAHPEQLVQRAAERGMSALALTDRDAVTGAVRFAQAALEHGIRPIFGVNLAVASIAPTPAQRRRTPVRGGAHVYEPPHRVVLLAQSRIGWARLCRLTSAAHTHGDGPPLLTWDDLHQHAGEGLTVLLGPASEPVRALAAGRPDLAEHLLAPWRQLPGIQLRLETCWLGYAGTGPGSLRLAARTLTLADQLGMPAVLTNAIRYADAGQHRLADVLDAARLLRPIDRRRLDSGERWLKDPAAMHEIARRIAAAAGHGDDRAGRLMAETATTADACVIDPVRDLGLGRPHFPEPAVVGAPGGPEHAAQLLRERAEAGLIRRGLDRDPRARRRLEEELAVIRTLQYDSYFLTVAQVVEDVRELGIRVAARGSGAGSMVNHTLGIATANPLDFNLLMERFLSVRRASLPDIDIDVESARRLEVYDRIIERFGTERVAVTGMPETYRARHALRDTGLALGIAPYDVDRIAKSFPHIRAADITAALAELPELRKLADEAGRYRLLFELAEGLDALPRGLAMHPCGVIVSDATLLDRLPVQPTPGGYPMVQMPKEGVEDLGLIKLDVLGVRMQSAMAHAVTEIERVTGQHIDLDDPQQVPLDDHFAFKLIQDAQTLGLFQLESPGQQDLLSRLQPRNVADVIADISLFRPGPVAGGMPEQYIAARHGATPTYPHPDLEPVLADTYGVVIWHEQIIEIIATLTGCDRALAEVARRTLADPARLPRLRDWFHRTGAARGYSSDVLTHVWKIIEAFGAYGFCRAHAVAFAVPALQSAWLKAHYPAFLLAGLLEHDPGMWPKRVLIQDARRRGVTVLPVDINASRTTHTVERAPDGTWAVRLALSGVRGIHTDEAERIVAGQPYASLSDLWQRARPNRPTAERLAQAGVLDSLRGTLTRRDLLLQITELHRQYRGRPLGDGQLPMALEDHHTSAPSGLPEMTSREALNAELHILGVDVSRHLMDHHHQLLRELGATDAAHLKRLRPGQQVLVAGVRASTQTPPIRSGKRVIFVTLEDGSGLVDLAFFEDSHEACAHTIFHSGLLLVRGNVQRRGERNTVTGSMVWDLEQLAAARRDHGPEAVQRLLGAGADVPPAPRTEPHRTITHETGATMHPWADLQPPGQRAADLTKLGHQSPGSAG